MNTYTYDLLYFHLYLLSLDFKTVYPLVVYKYPSTYMYPSLLHKMAPFCMNTAKKSSGGEPLDPPFKHNCFKAYYTHKY